jgi:hypothetical protein
MKQKKQIIVLVVLAVVAALIWTFEWRQKTPSTITLSFIQDYKPLGEENPQIHWGLLKRAQETEYKSNGRNPFIMNAAPTPDDAHKPKPPVIPAPPIVPVAPTPTTASLPPNLKYFGYGTIPNGTPRRAFFTDGEEIFIVSEGDTLLGRYRILKVGNASLEFQEISSGLPGTTPLDEQAAPPSA